ncbi:MAG: helix-turn-helix transcriptional regulator [Endomicrobiales bacterium]|nr:helix-turn-helix transcriptional regulator [Endomicrobiales bacterium]
MSIKSKITADTLKTLEKITKNKLTLGKLLCAIREGEEIPQIKFAEMLGISKQHLCDLEHNRKCISPKLAANYAKKLGYSSEQFIQLALQDIVNRAGLCVTINVIPKSNYSHLSRSVN